MANTNNKNIFQIIPVGILCLLLSVAASSCHATEEKQEAVAEQQKQASPAATEIVNAKKGKLASSIQVPGELIPYQQVDIYAKENSFVKKVFADVGSEVKAGPAVGKYGGS